jgi:uncharacterized pyridoxal phosphate-containing UPF0001 family protein
MSISSHLAEVKQAIAECEKEAGREDGSVSLIAVSKTFDADTVEKVLKVGQRVFGENKVQEAKGKWPQLREKYDDVELHLIGPLQSNKAKDAVALFARRLRVPFALKWRSRARNWGCSSR